MKNAIEICNLVKKYDSKFQLGSLDLKIPSRSNYRINWRKRGRKNDINKINIKYY